MPISRENLHIDQILTLKEILGVTLIANKG